MGISRNGTASNRVFKLAATFTLGQIFWCEIQEGFALGVISVVAYLQHENQNSTERLKQRSDPGP
jgi:hypothetical protein